MLRRVLLALALCSVVIGVTAAKEKPKPPFVIAADQTLAPPPADQAQIVFLEPINSIQGLIPVGLFEIEGENRTPLAITGSKSKVALLFTPGKHTLMANHSGMIAHFLDIDVEAGKRYYVLVRFIYGRGFQLRPIRTSGPSDYSTANKDFPRWNAETRFVEATPEGLANFELNRERVDKTQKEGWAKWLAKTPEERAELTLTPADAVAP